ncbi:MAG: hypothetical protein PHN75_04525 [Syntrophales bacterium]|nr:hypothetical protein [Syntrophales bacterium]
MKKAACAVLMIIMVIFLVYPLASEARGGRWGGGHWGYRGWWGPAVVVGGAAVLAAPYYGRYYAPYYSPYYSPYYYDPYYAPPAVVIPERAPVSGQQAPPAAMPSERTFIYPRQGQTEKQQAADRYECHRWSVSQTGFDPTQPSGGMPEGQLYQKRSDYNRALGACLDGRGYTMK